MDGRLRRPKVRALVPTAVDAALELVGTTRCPNLARNRDPRRRLLHGILSKEWIVERFYPIEYHPRRRAADRLRRRASDLPQAVLQDFSTPVAAGVACACRLQPGVCAREIAIANADMEDRATPWEAGRAPVSATRGLHTVRESRATISIS